MFKNGSFRLWIILISAALAVLLVVPAAAAQTGTQLRYGDTVSGQIDEATPCQLYWFQGSAGDPVTIDLTRTSGDLDGNLTLYQRDGNNLTADPVAANDDRPGGGLDPLIDTTLPATDWYTIAACRLQAERMRVTTGTFTLTLTGPQTAVVSTPTPALSLSDSIFGGNNAKPTPAAPLSDVIGSTPPAPNAITTLSDGSDVTGRLAAGVPAVNYDLPVAAGDSVFIEWQRQSGNVSPLLRITDPGGRVLAESSTPDAVNALTLTFTASADGTLALSVTRSGGAGDNTAGDYQLRVSIVPGGTSAAPTPEPQTTAEATPDYLANPCTTGANAVVGLASSDRLIDVYTAAGDSYYADQLDRTTTFRTDDDLNVVFRVEWESTNVPWVTGDWYVEVYVNGQVELTLGFSVQ
jgi:hypothetical protein